jgi:DNA mismatch repair protein MutS2
LPYPSSIENKLAFNQIKELVSSKCLSPMGAAYAQKLRFLNRYDLVERLLLQTKEFKRILEESLPFPDQNYLDVGPWLYKARIEGIWLLEEELHQVRLTVHTFLQIARFLRERTGLFPNLEALMEGLLINDLVIRRIDRVLEPDGKLKPNASPELAKLSQKIHEKETEIRRKTQKLFDKYQELEYLADNIGISIRDGRLVLPVLAEHKRHVPGFMHDESQTGQTVFIEPTECFELNNFLRELQIAFRRERERILLETTDQLRPEIPELEKNQQRLGLFDFVRAKALLALEMKADMPILSRHPGIMYLQAYHPLLKMSHDKLGQKTVPLNVSLQKENHIMVISGPNAGGKSVCLKTIGLLQYMLQSGFLIPCDAASEVGIFKEMMVDIGDEQSIENDLSTYSSHLLSMKNFTEFADAKTLFLIDEFGTGTDPQFGGPLAEAILHHLSRKKAFGVVTTHFSNLKNFANHTPGLLNASMLFDHEALQPLYVLETGKPGSSYAFELAVKSGLNQQIINYAKNKVGDKQRKVEELLVELEREKQHVNELRKRFSEKEEKTEVLLKKYEALTAAFEAEKKQMLKKAKQEALALVSEANSKIEATIREIKQEQANSEVQKKARTLIKEEIQQLKEEVSEPENKEEHYVGLSVSSSEIQVGDLVRVLGQETPATVIELQKNKAVIGMGDLRSTVALNKLEKLAVDTIAAKKQAPKGIDFNAKMQHFSSELNVIGTRGEEALKLLEDYLDDAIILGIKQVRIVHGKGYGILRKLIRNSLKANKMVEMVQDEHIELGGDGVTIVTLKV